MYRLISATPSPYARKIRIQMAEKGIPFRLETEVPWNDDTTLPAHNPLEKLPVLIREDGPPIFESQYIFEWIEAMHPDPALLPADPADRLAVRRYEVIADGVCDALVLMFFENLRPEGTRSQAWYDRQNRKVEGGLAALAEMCGDGDFAWGDRFTLADIVTGTVVRYLGVRWSHHTWRDDHPNLARLSDRLEQRPSFVDTVPSTQNITAAVV